MAKQLGKSTGTETEAEPIHSQVSKKRAAAAKGHDGKEPPANGENQDKQPQTKKKCTRDHKHGGARRATETRNNRRKVKLSKRKIRKTRRKKQRATRGTIMPTETRKIKKGKDEKKAKSEE